MKSRTPHRGEEQMLAVCEGGIDKACEASLAVALVTGQATASVLMRDCFR